MEKTEGAVSPVCENKTPMKTREDEVLIKFPLFCPKCKQDTLVIVQ